MQFGPRLTIGGAASFIVLKNQNKRIRRHMIRYKYVSGGLVALLGFLIVSPLSRAQEPNKPMVYEGTVGGLRVIEEGQPPAMIHATVEDMKRFREANPHAQPGQVQAASSANDLAFHGGIGGIGVETAPKIYLVLWGSQWNNNDPSGEAAILETFYRGGGGSSWANSVTQYCEA
jgi:serine protease